MKTLGQVAFEGYAKKFDELCDEGLGGYLTWDRAPVAMREAFEAAAVDVEAELKRRRRDSIREFIRGLDKGGETQPK